MLLLSLHTAGMSLPGVCRHTSAGPASAAGLGCTVAGQWHTRHQPGRVQALLRQSGQYKSMVPVGMTTTYTVTNLSAGQTYYFAATAYDTTGIESAFSNEVSVTLPTNPPTNPPGGGLIPQQQMRVVSVDSQELVGENGVATNAIDGNPATFWHTQWSQQTAPLPHTLVLDLGGQYQVDGWRYLPRQDGSPNGTIAGYQVYVSPDGTTWGTAVAAGTLAANTSEKTVRFGQNRPLCAPCCRVRDQRSTLDQCG